jgi:MoxR-like ATPase
LYGPPGTGKTYVARRLATWLAGDAARVATVQLHPSYAYEDFVEGYRPQSNDGQAGFALVDGPLKRLARAAALDPKHPYVLVIDELNRGNVAKVFGELYFLLEYRGQAITLQYSGAPFSLPGNLWLIGTMNTADRSIALVDLALRRRFYFVPFFPDRPPVAGLLRRWLARCRPDLAWLAAVVDEANRLLADRDAALGPSYFLRADLSEEWIELIWQHAVLPYVAEQLAGDEDALAGFALDRLRAEVSPPPAIYSPRKRTPTPPHTPTKAPRRTPTKASRRAAPAPSERGLG